jgi:hypothetical protein
MMMNGGPLSRGMGQALICRQTGQVISGRFQLSGKCVNQDFGFFGSHGG